MYTLSGFRIWICIILAVFIMAIQGCDQVKQKQQSTESADFQKWAEIAKKIDEFVYQGPLFLGQNSSRKSLSEIRQLGEIKNESVKYANNPHVEGEKIEFRTFVFEGLVLYGVVDKQNFYAITIIITNPKWKILYDLNVESPASRVPAALGQPPRPMQGPVERFSGQTESVDFTIDNGKIAKIEFNYYFD
jgi:hypothetical protein